MIDRIANRVRWIKPTKLRVMVFLFVLATPIWLMAAVGGLLGAHYEPSTKGWTAHTGTLVSRSNVANEDNAALTHFKVSYTDSAGHSQTMTQTLMWNLELGSHVSVVTKPGHAARSETPYPPVYTPLGGAGMFALFTAMIMFCILVVKMTFNDRERSARRRESQPPATSPA